MKFFNSKIHKNIFTRICFLLSYRMGTDLTRSEIDMLWSSSNFPMDKSVPFANLIRQIIIFNRDDNRLALNQCKLYKELFLYI